MGWGRVLDSELRRVLGGSTPQFSNDGFIHFQFPNWLDDPIFSVEKPRDVIWSLEFGFTNNPTISFK